MMLIFAEDNRNMKKTLITLCIISSFCSCVRRVPPTRHEVVIVMNDCPIQASTSRLTGRTSQTAFSTISYIDTTGDLVQYEPRNLGRDTLTVPTFNGYAEIMHLYQAVEFDTFLLKEGDTVLVNYDQDLTPVLTSLVFGNMTEAYNFAYTLPHAIQAKGYHIETVLKDLHFTRPYQYFKEPALQDRYPNLKAVLQDMFIDLDSLSLVYSDYQTAFKTGVDSMENACLIDGFYADYLRKRFIPALRHSPASIVQSDSLLHFISNYVRAQDYCQDEDALVSFERMAEDTIATDLARKVILKRLLNRIISGEDGWHLYSKDVVERCTSRYIDLTGDSLFTQEKHATPVSVSESGYYLPLEDKHGQTTTLASIIEQNKGKVIYVDFWASWCAPCRAEMPYSQSLQKRLSGQDIVFLFLSTDTDGHAWRNAVKEESETMSDTYRILDGDTPFIKELRLNTIPRYIIFDPNGRLVDVDAKRPSSKDIEDILLNYTGLL